MRTHDTGWAGHAVWWHVYPLGFLGAPRTGDPGAEPVHRLPALANWLDHLVGLGANGLALGPVFASQTHGYDTVDHFRVDPRLGTEDDLVALIEACHARGVRVQLDGVFNHVGRGFGRFADVLRDAGSPSASWFRIGGDPEGDDAVGYADFEGHHELVALNHDEPEVAAYVGEVLRHWCERGVDSWRLDAAYAVPPGFWAPVLAGLRETHPDVWVVGEVIHGDYVAYVEQGGIDSVTQYELWKAIWSSINDGNMFELGHALGRHDTLLAAFLPLTFVGNHDVTRLATQIADPRHVGHALAVWLTTPGVPSVYYGDELGRQGRKEDRAGGDDAVRPAFPESPGGLPPDPSGRAGETYELHQRLIGLRRRHPWLAGARIGEPLLLTNEAIATDVRAAGGGRLVTVLNVGDDEVRVPGVSGLRLLTGDGQVDVTGDRAGDGEAVTVPGHAWAVLGTEET